MRERWLWRIGVTWGVLAAGAIYLSDVVFGEHPEPLTAIFLGVLVGCTSAGRARDNRRDDAVLIGHTAPATWYRILRALDAGELTEDAGDDLALGRLVHGRRTRLAVERRRAAMVGGAAVALSALGGLLESGRGFLLAAVAGVAWAVVDQRQRSTRRRLDRIADLLTDPTRPSRQVA